MSVIVKRCIRSRKNVFLTLSITLVVLVYYFIIKEVREENLDVTRSVVMPPTTVVSVDVSHNKTNTGNVAVKATYVPTADVRNRESVIVYIESRIEEALREEKGSGCLIPKLDPFAKEVMQFEKNIPNIKCSGRDWVRCHLSECKVIEPILAQMEDVKCVYKDILYESDNSHKYGPPKTVLGSESYILEKSDHVRVECEAERGGSTKKWLGFTLGFRKLVPQPSPPGREKSLNVLIFGFDSTSKNGFIRRMPKSYKVLTEEFQSVLLNGYNIVGDGTPAALFPLLTGKTELELPDARRKTGHTQHMDGMPFIFYTLKDDGYRTAYFEDSPWIGTFQYRFNGFLHQPADHYLRAFYLSENKEIKRKKGEQSYCLGDRPQFSMMMDITTQFFQQHEKKYCFTFIGDITHDDFNWISTADDSFVEFLRQFKEDGHLEDTLLFVMGDHGPRYANVRDTLQGKQEERLPLMAITLPKRMTREHPEYLVNLKANADTLTSPFDIHSTIVEAIGLSQHKNPYKVSGAELPRSLSLLHPVPSNRSCSEAGIEPHWCACLQWRNVSQEEDVYQKAADALVDYINNLTESHRPQCAIRVLISIEWVMRQMSNSAMLSFKKNKDTDGYIGLFGAKTKITSENFQVKIAVSPGRGVYEASMKYYIQKNEFVINSTDISRINAYGDEPSCISSTNPHLNMYCYCNN